MSKNLKVLTGVLLIALFAVYLTACGGSSSGGEGGGSGVNGGGAPLPPPQTKLISGTINLPADSLIDPEELTVRAITGNTSVNNIGVFANLEAVNEGLGQVVFVENADGNAIAVAYISADDIAGGNITIGYEEMALGLIKLNPYLMVLSPEQESLVLDKARDHADFFGLVTDIENALTNSPDNALDYESYPYIYQKAVSIGIEVIAGYSGSTQSITSSAYTNLAAAVGSDYDPHIEDPSGPDITLVNPKQTFYGVDLGNGEKTLLNGRGGVLTTDIGWSPPWEWVTTTTPYEKDWNLGDGTFQITFYKGFNIPEDGWLLPETAAGKATYANFLKMFGMLMKTVGLFPGFEAVSIIAPSDSSIQFLLTVDNIPVLDFSEIAGAITGSVNWRQLLLQNLPDFIGNHWDDISYWVWQGGTIWTSDPEILRNVSDFMRDIGKAFNGIHRALPVANQLLTVLEAENQWIPFFYDLVTAPSKLEYTISQTDGIVTEVFSLIPPTALFTVDNTNPIISEDVNFNASGSSDDYDSSESLQVRWDLDGDGAWETSWSTDKYVSYSYPGRGTYCPILEVRDSDGLMARSSLDIVVGSQQALKIVLTWGNEPTDLDSHLYTPEIEGSNYHIYYVDKGSLESPPYAWLDIDDTSSYGPETIWFERLFTDTYTYSVYNYSGVPDITTSSAHVEVIDAQGVIAAFDVPVIGSGRWWNVFTLDGTTGEIARINTISDNGTVSSSAQALTQSTGPDDPMPPKEY